MDYVGLSSLGQPLGFPDRVAATWTSEYVNLIGLWVGAGGDVQWATKVMTPAYMCLWSKGHNFCGHIRSLSKGFSQETND